MFKFAKLASLLGIMYAAAPEGASGNVATAAGPGTVVPNGTDAAAAPAAEAAPAVVNGKKQKYFFKTEKLKNEKGETIGEGRKHPDVEVILPMPTAIDAINFLAKFGEVGEDNKTPTPDAKVAALLMEGIEDLVIQAGRGQINDFLEKDPKGTFTATNFDFSKLTLQFISTLEKGQRGAWAPSEDDMKQFTDDYSSIFTQIVQYDPAKVAVHVKALTAGLSKIKSDKAAVGKMKEFLLLWASKTQNMEANVEVYDYLIGKADKYLAAEEKDFASSL